ncbi:hypothetical protein ACFY12_20995 [Streptomyces sp. NPDC001339]|uniref:hypothetical protein n=1 Tax=Streptomyces sp. NPDC001339 TaxID=3364563 RepID=UPI00368DA523
MNTAAGRDWTAMQRADFDLDVPGELPVPTGAARIPAAPDPIGTPALFGEPVPEPPAPRRPPSRPGDVDGQDQLF